MRVREQRDAEAAQAYCRKAVCESAVVETFYSENAWRWLLLHVPTKEQQLKIHEASIAYLSGMYAERDRAEKAKETP